MQPIPPLQFLNGFGRITKLISGDDWGGGRPLLPPPGYATVSKKKIGIHHPVIRFNNIPVTKVEEHKHLGVVLDSKLSFSAHIKAAISKTRKGIGLLRHLTMYLPRNTLNELFKLYVRPHLDYGDVIYHIPAKVCEFSGNTILSNLMEKLESVQYSAALAITGAWRGTSREKLYAELGWESLCSRRWSRRQHCSIK